MTTILASCSECLENTEIQDTVQLHVCDLPALCRYEFRCRLCRCWVVKHADAEAISKLLSGGVRAQHFTVPAEAVEPHDGPPISLDDALDLALALRATDLLAAEVTA